MGAEAQVYLWIYVLQELLKFGRRQQIERPGRRLCGDGRRAHPLHSVHT